MSPINNNMHWYGLALGKDVSTNPNADDRSVEEKMLEMRDEYALIGNSGFLTGIYEESSAELTLSTIYENNEDFFADNEQELANITDTSIYSDSDTIFLGHIKV